MRHALAFCFCVFLASCGGVAWDTTVSDTPAVRMQMVQSLRIGETTDDAFVLRWGPPLQKAREGGREEFIYRNMTNPEGYIVPRFGDSASYVIVTFRYGRAVAVRIPETEGCRATFPPSPPGPGFAHFTTVHPAATCPGVGPLQGRVHPIDRAVRQWTGQNEGSGVTPTGDRPGVPEDRFAGDGKAD